MALKPLLPASTERPKMEMLRGSQSKAVQRVIASQFELSTLLLIGALAQGTLLLLIPRIWVLLPTVAVLLTRFATTVAITLKLIPNPQMKGSMLHRTVAVIPDVNGDFNKEGHPANEKIAILLLGLRINHPLGYFSPGMQKIGDFNNKMMEALDAEAPNNGFLGQTTWNSKSTERSEDALLISYWRSIEDVHNFSVGPSHRATWDWWNRNAEDLKHVGISHEVFQADRAMYESVYLNFQPTRLGGTTFLRKGDELVGGTVPDTWINPLVDASRGKLRNSKGRLGWSTEEERVQLLEKQGY